MQKLFRFLFILKVVFIPGYVCLIHPSLCMESEYYLWKQKEPLLGLFGWAGIHSIKLYVDTCSSHCSNSFHIYLYFIPGAGWWYAEGIIRTHDTKTSVLPTKFPSVSFRSDTFGRIDHKQHPKTKIFSGTLWLQTRQFLVFILSWHPVKVCKLLDILY